MKTFEVDYREKLPGYNLAKIKKESDFPNRKNEKGIVNPDTGSSVLLNENGGISLSSSKYSNYNLDYDGHAREISMQSTTVTNRKSINTDELVVNGHKLNPQLYELSDSREALNNKNNAIVDLNMSGTVLVKAWEPHLEKYVLIRRPYRGPIFSPKLNAAKIPDEMR